MTYLLCFFIFCAASIATLGAVQQTREPTNASNPDLRQELLKMLEQDQAIRKKLIEKQTGIEKEIIFARMRASDTDNTVRLKTIIQQYGWPDPKLVGEDGVNAAFIILQHSDHDRNFQNKMLPTIRRAYEQNCVSGGNYALLMDRVRIGNDLPQIYGTQAKIEYGKEPVLYPIEDEIHVDKRRLMLICPLANYIEMLKAVYK